MSTTKLSKNAPCPCGSGKKYKRCCMAKRMVSFTVNPAPLKNTMRAEVEKEQQQLQAEQDAKMHPVERARRDTAGLPMDEIILRSQYALMVVLHTRREVMLADAKHLEFVISRLRACGDQLDALPTCETNAIQKMQLVEEINGIKQRIASHKWRQDQEAELHALAFAVTGGPKEVEAESEVDAPQDEAPIRRFPQDGPIMTDDGDDPGDDDLDDDDSDDLVIKA